MPEDRYVNVCCPDCGADLREPGSVAMHGNVTVMAATQYSAGTGDFLEFPFHDPRRQFGLKSFSVHERTCFCQECSAMLTAADLVPAKGEEG